MIKSTTGWTHWDPNTKLECDISYNNIQKLCLDHGVVQGFIEEKIEISKKTGALTSCSFQNQFYITLFRKPFFKTITFIIVKF